MQCKSCGAQLTIHDFTCPYCGTQNPEAEAYFKQHQKDVLERDAQVARARAEVEKTRMVTDLHESVEGSRKAMKFLTVLLIICGITSIAALAVNWTMTKRYDSLYMPQEREKPTSGAAAEFLQMKEQYEEAYLDACFDFHQEVNEFYDLTDSGDIPDEYLFRDLARYSSDVWMDLHPQYDWQERDSELVPLEETYLLHFFEQEFQYTRDDCWWLSPEDGYLAWEDAESAGKELRKRYLEVR